MLDGQAIRNKDLPLFLNQMEASYAMSFKEATPEDKSILDVNVKGFESLSFDWTLALSKCEFSNKVCPSSPKKT